MIEMAAAAAGLLLIALFLFALSIRAGIYLGRRFDGAIEERAALGDPTGEVSETIDPVGPVDRLSGKTPPSRSPATHLGQAGQEEIHGE